MLTSEWRRVAVLLSGLAVAVWLGLAASRAVAAGPGSLSGETLGTAFETVGSISAAPSGFGPQISSANCTAAGTSSFGFTATGTATGPYPGTFSASGSVTVGPQSGTAPGPVVGAPELPAGPLTSFSETFTIDSPAMSTTITGTKTLVSGTGSCDEFAGQVFPLLGSLDAFGHEYAFNPEASFVATLSTPSGQFEETGTTRLTADELQGQDAVAPEANGVIQGSFEESFLESKPVAAPASVTLTPATATQPVETPRTLAATVTTAEGSPAPHDTVDFTVRGDVNTTGSCVTNAKGQCGFTYPGPPTPGHDAITGCAGPSGDAPCGAASTTWVVPTSTSVSCSPSRVAVAMSTTCTATVSDTAGNGQSTPTGTVSFGSNEEGVFAGSPCTLSGSGVSASCSVTYTPTEVGSGTSEITASYSGDPAHTASSGGTSVTVTSPTCPKTSIDSNFNGTPIGGEDWIWFNSVFKLTGPTAGGTITFSNLRVIFGSTTASVPNAVVILSPTAKEATTTFTAGAWVTTVPVSFTDDVFLSGLAYRVPAAGLPGGIKPVTWKGVFSATPGITIQWQWAAAVYTQFTNEYNALEIKPTHSTSIDKYHNGDQAGTPENSEDRSRLTGGATGGGGSNFTGSYSATVPCP